jgi:hypothetical protein
MVGLSRHERHDMLSLPVRRGGLRRPGGMGTHQAPMIRSLTIEALVSGQPVRRCGNGPRLALNVRCSAVYLRCSAELYLAGAKYVQPRAKSLITLGGEGKNDKVAFG